MSKKFDIDFELESGKITTSVKLIPKDSKIPLPYDAILDTGCNKTTISRSLFETLGYSIKDKREVTIIGINGESKGFSTVIDNFILGDTDLGSVRVTVADVQKEFTNKIILGMNILMWFNLLISYSNKRLTFATRVVKGYTTTRFSRSDTSTINLTATQTNINNQVTEAEIGLD